MNGLYPGHMTHSAAGLDWLYLNLGPKISTDFVAICHGRAVNLQPVSTFDLVQADEFAKQSIPYEYSKEHKVGTNHAFSEHGLCQGTQTEGDFSSQVVVP